MNLNSRIAKIEAASIEAQIKRLTDNIAKVPDAQIINLWELMAAEALKRKIVDSPEIEAAKSIYQNLLADGLTKEEAAADVLRLAESEGLDIEIEDFI
jgi:acyl-[acyl carrier protein]--UDP-N-acetylglucosamine O-acyltransferase